MVNNDTSPGERATKQENSVRVRIAPSPTGPFHIGTARTALFNFLYAKKFGGVFVLRIEDTDTERSEERFTQDIYDCLAWLGLNWDEGPVIGGEFGPYAQSERLAIYQKSIDQLLSQGAAYKCYCTAEELEAERQEQQKAGKPPKYSGRCRSLTHEQIAQNDQAKKPFSVRFRVTPEPIKFTDLIHGEMSFDAGLFGDFAITRRDGSPLFLLTNTIDDNAMGITHVLRGEDHLSNTAKQLLLCQGLRFLPPQFGHLPLILNPDRSKLSKRKNPVSITADYRAKGYLPEALVNYLALLGWAPGNDRELFTMHELIQEFSIERVGSSNAVFDADKLLWMNGYYIRHLPIGELAARAAEFVQTPAIKTALREKPEYFLQALSLVQDRLKTLAEVDSAVAFCFVTPRYDGELLVAKKSTPARTKAALLAALGSVKNLERLVVDEAEISLRTAAKKANLTDGELLWSVRVALTGLAASPGVFEVLEVLGKAESLKRLDAALKKL